MVIGMTGADLEGLFRSALFGRFLFDPRGLISWCVFIVSPFDIGAIYSLSSEVLGLEFNTFILIVGLLYGHFSPYHDWYRCTFTPRLILSPCLTTHPFFCNCLLKLHKLKIEKRLKICGETSCCVSCTRQSPREAEKDQSRARCRPDQTTIE
jgi:hypothetical protein